MSGEAKDAKISGGKGVFAVLSNKTAFLLAEDSELEIGKFEQVAPFKDDLSNESEQRRVARPRAPTSPDKLAENKDARSRT